ncbi:hypothetical protein MMC14_001560 [Varicellaria rhodocarpa]|nr:hypothetical protein [Varicellaria rhodocarpa]
MDGDHSAKTMEQGSNSAMKAGSEFTEGIHESVNQVPAAGEKTQGTGTSMFSKDGAVGSMFNGECLWVGDEVKIVVLEDTNGAIGGTAQKVGGPFDKEGAVGKQFNADGGIGGAVQQKIAENNSK